MDPLDGVAGASCALRAEAIREIPAKKDHQCAEFHRLSRQALSGECRLRRGVGVLLSFCQCQAQSCQT
jgi:hypothetical protein